MRYRSTCPNLTWRFALLVGQQSYGQMEGLANSSGRRQAPEGQNGAGDAAGCI